MKKTILTLFLIGSCYLAFCQSDENHISFVENFSDASSAYFRYGSTGNKSPFKYSLGIPSPTETGTNILSFKIDPSENAGPGKGPEIISTKFTHFGTYATRLRVPDVKDIQPNVGAVVGYFTYHEDSLEGLSEIDFEWLLADPTVIYVGTWTGPPGELKRVGRIINLAEGIIYNTSYRENHTGIREPLTGLQDQPETIPALKGFDASKAFYTYGFDWYPERIRWWMIHPDSGEKIILWDYQGTKRGIPQHASKYRMNFWHTKDWSVETNPLSLEPPLHPYELEVDWMSYEPLK